MNMNILKGLNEFNKAYDKIKTLCENEWNNLNILECCKEVDGLIEYVQQNYIHQDKKLDLLLYEMNVMLYKVLKFDRFINE